VKPAAAATGHRQQHQGRTLRHPLALLLLLQCLALLLLLKNFLKKIPMRMSLKTRVPVAAPP
jgi:hypothetical protein